MTRTFSAALRLAGGVIAAAVIGVAPFSMRAQSPPSKPAAGRAAPAAQPAQAFRPLKILMLGQDQRHHDSAALDRKSGV